MNLRTSTRKTHSTSLKGPHCVVIWQKSSIFSLQLNGKVGFSDFPLFLSSRNMIGAPITTSHFLSFPPMCFLWFSHSSSRAFLSSSRTGKGVAICGYSQYYVRVQTNSRIFARTFARIATMVSNWVIMAKSTINDGHSMQRLTAKNR